MPGPRQSGGAPADTDTPDEQDTDSFEHRENDEWRADQPKDGDQLGTLWIRWTDGGSALELHRVCELIPQVERKEDSFFPSVVPETGDQPRFRPVGQSDSPGGNVSTQENQELVQFRFVSGLPRQLLRHVPLLILVSTLVLFVGAELSNTVAGASTLVPIVTDTSTVLLGIFVAIVPLLLWLLIAVEVIPVGDVGDAAGIYGLAAFLGVSTVASILLVFVADHPSDVNSNVVLVSGYLLMLLLGGMLAYEAVLRIEHMFAKLHKRSGDIVTNERAYRKFLTDVNQQLNDVTIVGVHPSRLFGFLFALQFLIIWTLGSGPQGMNYRLGLVVNFVLNVVLVTIVFQFFVFVRYFNRLMNETKDYSEVGLNYEPFHVDGYGGFRDFGRFATRINIILTIGGLYLVYRLYFVGGRELPVEGFLGFSDPITANVWLISFAGPVLAYGAGIIAWGYYSFWSIHRKMARDKKLLTRKYQGQRGPPDANRSPSAGDTIDSFEDAEGPEWASLRAAPTWPLKVNKLLSLISGNIFPLFVPVVNLFF